MFEVTKDQLRGLSDEQLREFVAHLCEAELAVRSKPRSAVRWGGAQTAPDGGLDVEVKLEDAAFVGDFVPRGWTGIQVKKHQMPPAEIAAEMSPKGALRPKIEEISKAGGAYLIVSLEDDPTGKPLDNRHDAMKAQISHMPTESQPFTRFLGRAELAQWLAVHSGVQLWVRKQLNVPLSGWRPFDRWSATPAGADDTLLSEDGVRIRLPGSRGEGETVIAGINAIRNLVRTSQKAIRIAGLSGVGKSRIVQALFEQEVGDNALEQTKAIYADLGGDLDPTASDLLNQLVAEKRDVILVLDNCPAEVHSRLSQRLSREGCSVRLITVEYDIRDDKPEATEVVRIEAVGTAAVEALVRRRFPATGRVNAERIAEFSQGNARLALALADQLEVGESLTGLSNDVLFRRLFHQRNVENDDLMAAAEALSLVYSFSVEADEDGTEELGILAGLIGQDRRKVYAFAQLLLERQIAQKRGRWRAVLPHAIANKLASTALRRISLRDLREAFEQPGAVRLLRSFARRLGYLHDQDVAVAIVRGWLSDGGILANVASLDEDGVVMLLNAAPAAPGEALAAIERGLAGAERAEFVARANNRNFSTIVNLLAAIAYDEEYFERCVGGLTAFARHEREGENNDSIRDRLYHLFSLYLSGTQAKPEFRATIASRYLRSDDPAKLSMGLGMMRSALEANRWSAAQTFSFGAHLRGYGYAPLTYEEKTAWYQRFLGVAIDGLAEGTHERRAGLRRIVADKFRFLWRHPGVRVQLIEFANIVHREAPWIEGWRAVRGTLYFDYRGDRRTNDAEGARLLDDLAEQLRPKELEAEIRSFVLDTGHNVFSLMDEFDFDDANKWEKARKAAAERAENLGLLASEDAATLAAVLPEMFTSTTGYAYDFGRGLAQGTTDVTLLWQGLVEELVAVGDKLRQPAILIGALKAIHEKDTDQARVFLDTALEIPACRKIFVSLQRAVPFDDRCIERIHRCLDMEDTYVLAYGDLAWVQPFDQMDEGTLAEILTRVMAKANGEMAVLDGLTMRFHGMKEKGMNPGLDLRRVGLIAAAKAIRSKDSDAGHHRLEHQLERILDVCLTPAELPVEGQDVLAAVMERVKASYGYISGLSDALSLIAARLPREFLDEIFLSPVLKDSHREGVFRDSYDEKNPLADVPVEVLLEWAKHQNSDERLVMLARAISPFNRKDEDGNKALSCHALALIENAIEPAEIVRSLAEAVEPRSWSGSRAEIIAGRCSGFEPLLRHEKPAVRSAAEEVISQVTALVARERDRERHQDEEREQTFE